MLLFSHGTISGKKRVKQKPEEEEEQEQEERKKRKKTRKKKERKKVYSKMKRKRDGEEEKKKKKEQQQQHQQYLVGELWPEDGKHGDEDDDKQHCGWTAGHGDVPVPRPTTQPPPGRLHVLFHVHEQRGAVEQRPTRSCTVGLVEMTLNVTAKYTQQCIVIIIVIIKFLVLPLAEQKKMSMSWDNKQESYLP